jgi:predicted nucleotidyltransferase
MEQKDYNLEIVGILLKGKNHIRGISNLLKTNHMMVFRKISSLEKKNVVDFIMEGRNKVYFLKNSPEARAYILMFKNYQAIKLLTKYKFLRELFLAVQNEKKIKFACIFGSYSKGNETKNSDIDIYIENEDSTLKKKYSNLDSKFSVKIGKWDSTNYLIKEILDNNVIIKGGEIFYERLFG